MATKIITKNSSTTTAIPTAGDLVQGELAVNVTDKRLFTEDSGGTIVELGTSPSTIDINAGTIDGTVIGGTTAAAATVTTLTTTGTISIPNLVGILGRNFADSGNLTMLQVDTADIIRIDPSSFGVRVGGPTTFNNNVTLTKSGASDAKVQIDNTLANAASTASLVLGAIGNNFVLRNYPDADASNANRTDFSSSATGSYFTFSPNGAERMRIDSAGNLGIGTTSPAIGGGRTYNVALTIDGGVSGGAEDTGALEVGGSTSVNDRLVGSISYFNRDNSGAGATTRRQVAIIEARSVTSDSNAGDDSGANLTFSTKSEGGSVAERMRIDASGNVLVGKTASSFSVAGIGLMANNQIMGTAASDNALALNRLSTDGDIAKFYKDGTVAGSIQAVGGDLNIGTGDTALLFVDSLDAILPAITTDPAAAPRDNAIDLGRAATRFNDIYATNGTIQTSDRNEKQDIEELSAAETAVAVACKGLLRKFRWIDSVEEKGDDARIHFGIIAQDLQAAFAAEGLDAGRYAMFISSTWWETQTEVDAVEAVEFVQAVEAVYNEDGELVSDAVEGVEAVEAKDAYTRTDTFQTLADAPEGATERTRLGVRYPELLTFIIAAI